MEGDLLRAVAEYIMHGGGMGRSLICIWKSFKPIKEINFVWRVSLRGREESPTHLHITRNNEGPSPHTIRALISLKEAAISILTHGLHFVAAVLLENTTKDHGQGLYLPSGPGYVFCQLLPLEILVWSLLPSFESSKNHHLSAVNCLLLLYS